ncbi:MAG TPA: S41 family peptidase [Pirellulaceae bacterium]|nr:S41 family peptidase [Pirellulaceae bacterium]HMO90584.1 S41 family peptidase [Pirellulaceae bacterium]HMP67837.1 S41 family peptidase [Pirellulaceae bacterium]
MIKNVFTAITSWIAILSSGLLFAQDVPGKPSGSMMRYPAVSASHIVFSYAGDLWVVSRDGGVANPLASPPGNEAFPRFSPDGKRIAFVGNYDGNQDIYVIPIDGGVPERLTHHPAGEILSDWAADGRLVFSSNGLSGFERSAQLFTITEEDRFPRKLKVPYGTNGVLSDDGKWLAYTPMSRDERTWKRYRGGWASDIWLFNLETNESKQITDWEGTDSFPMFHGDKVYYLSDAGENFRLNIWSYHLGTGERTQVTNFDEFDCKWPSIGPGNAGQGEIVLQNGSSLWLVDLASGASKALDISVPGHKPNIRATREDVSSLIGGGDISPNAKRVVVEARGDIWTLPVSEGTPRNLTATSGVAERSPNWSPDGRWIAYFSDASGEYELYITQSDGRGETKQLTHDGNCFRYNPTWSPDSKHIAFADKTGAIYIHSLDGETKLVDTDPHGTPPNVSWSHDSNWLTYSLGADARVPTSVIYVYSIADATRHQITSGFFSDSNPVFDRKGEFLYFVSSRAFNRPQYEDNGTTFIYAGTQVLLAMPLRADVKLPMQPKNEEETWKTESEKKENGSSNGEKKNDNDKADDEKKADEPNQDQPTDEASDTDPVSGTWTISVDSEFVPETERTVIAELNLAADGTVTGTIDIPSSGTIPISNGKFDAASSQLTFNVVRDGMTIVVSVNIEGNKLSGSASNGEIEFPLSGTRTGKPGTKQDEAKDDDKPAEAAADDKSKTAEPFKIEFDNLGYRTFQLPVSQGNFNRLTVNDKNQLIYTRQGSRGAEGGAPTIHLYDMHEEKPSEKVVVAGAGNYTITPDGKKLLVQRGQSMYVFSAAAGQKLEGEVSKTGMVAMINPREEWKQILTDAWRVQRDFFYDPHMHGNDWQAIYDQYVRLLDDCTSRSDVGFVIGEMIAELNVGHAYYRPEPSQGSPWPQHSKVGLLGCTFRSENGRYRIDTIFEGAEWDTDARNPLRAVGIKEGDYLLAVNDVELTADMDPYVLFQGTANQVTVLTIGDDENLNDTNRRIVVKALESDSNLRFRHWIENNRRYVEEKTNGRVGYIYVVNTGVPGQNDLFRQFYGQLNKEALIIDDRWNGGGQIPTRFIELLNRPVTNHWATRDGRDWTWPPDSHQGPKCMLINGMAGSGGDMFPALFRQAGLGKLIGRRTWGGLVGISGNPSMIDGSSVTAPTFAYYRTDGTWGIEGHGVDPDIEVLDDPAKMVDGGDPQLDAAIELMLSELETNPYVPATRPPYPNRSKFGIDERDR